jgi:creatinine amidohydrolase/Fe(II)-dependent formamide hydrolase-like protein
MSIFRRPVVAALLAASVGMAAWTGFAARPLTAPRTDAVEMAEMTWIEIRDAVKSGATTVLVPSGGIEANGPHMITDKHQHIVRRAARMIAEAHGGMLVAPVLPLVPQGGHAPATGNMRWPGTIGVTPEVFAGTLDGVARSLKAAGFRRIVFIADHGQSQQPQAEVAARLAGEWRADGVQVIALGAYYSEGDRRQRELLVARGESIATIGDHAGLQDTAELMFAHPDGVKLDRLARPLGAVEPDGSSGRPERADAALGEVLLRAKVDAALAALRAAGI